MIALLLALTTAAGVHVHVIRDDVDCGHGFGRTFIVDRFRGGRPAQRREDGSWYRPGAIVGAISFSVWPDPMHCWSGPSRGWQIYGHLEPFQEWSTP
jgi:hypothetical protein